MKKPTKHEQIFTTLQADIQNRRYQPGDRLPSEGSLCRRWQVSRPTIRRALRDLQVAGLIRIKAGSGCYVQNNIHTAHPIFGLLAESLGKTEILDPIGAEIIKAAQARNCSVFNVHLSAGKSVAEMAQLWINRGVQGVIFAPIECSEERERLNLELIDTLQNAGMQVVLIDREATDFPKRSNYDVVSLDNFHAGYILGRHLAELGCRRIAFVAKPHFPSSTDLRLAGLEYGISTRQQAVDFHVGDTKLATFIKRLCKTKPRYDAVVCSNDLTAAQFLQGASQIGCRVPEDFLLAGFDDVSYASLLATPLTSIRQPCAEIGAVCIQTMLERIKQPQLPARSILLCGELVVRESTSKASS